MDRFGNLVATTTSSDGTPVTANLTYNLSNWSTLNMTGWDFGYGGRNGGNTGTMWVDDIAISTHKMASGSPLALDLNGDGVRTVDVSQGVYFDLYANGSPVQAGWVDRHDGLLALDLDGNGRIDSGAELFGNHTALRGGGQAADGWAALAQHDANQDGQIDAQDAVFGQLRVWQDANGNAVADPGELSSLAERGIVRIELQADDQAVAQNGNVLRNFSSYTTADGVQHEMVDAWFQSLTQYNSLWTPASQAPW
jgi:hypothetical protein